MNLESEFSPYILPDYFYVRLMELGEEIKQDPQVQGQTEKPRGIKEIVNLARAKAGKLIALTAEIIAGHGPRQLG